MRIVSLQSGTSADGIDVAVVDVTTLDASARPMLELETIAATTVPFDERLREEVLAFSQGAARTAFDFCRLDTELGQAFAATATWVRQRCGTHSEVDLVVSHGQTLHHWVTEQGRTRGTLQVGEPSWIARAYAAPVVAQLRVADIAGGCNGAPVMGVLDRAWLQDEAKSRHRTQASLNIGGIANLQLIRPDSSLEAFDTGPGNALIDALVERGTHRETSFDRDGALALAGAVDDVLLRELLEHPYFSLQGPKSTGRETFNLAQLAPQFDSAAARGLGLPDLVATATMLSARTIADAVNDGSSGGAIDRLIVSGGGARNPTLLRWIRDCLTDSSIVVTTSDLLGLPAEYKESLLFALLGFLSWHGASTRLPGTPPGGESMLGQFIPAPSGLKLPERQLDGVSALRFT